ncbi:hypothetical protein [Candidatus Kuenenia stuttgartiensis]|uniref:hypothetical protein n=1 Tax=Kuenenia stuttgartiensis TaxID=174633 RepID=UPI0012FEF6F3|nr:hypothetical protein [Candidatus Kuenenia stuttgartiensis]
MAKIDAVVFICGNVGYKGSTPSVKINELIAGKNAFQRLVNLLDCALKLLILTKPN